MLPWKLNTERNVCRWHRAVFPSSSFSGVYSLLHHALLEQTHPDLAGHGWGSLDKHFVPCTLGMWLHTVPILKACIWAPAPPHSAMCVFYLDSAVIRSTVGSLELPRTTTKWPGHRAAKCLIHWHSLIIAMTKGRQGGDEVSNEVSEVSK